MLGAIALVGAIGLLDLRMLGYARRLEIGVLVSATIPLALGGFLVMVASGAVLFAADAVALAGSTVFRLKLLLILLAAFNALAFHRLERRGVRGPGLRLIAGLSLTLWVAVVVCGRMIAYL